MHNDIFEAESNRSNNVPSLRVKGDVGITEVKHKDFPQLIPGQMYIVAEQTADDEGHTSYETDMVHCWMDKLEGKEVKVVTYVKKRMTRRFSQIPGAYFFGPLEILP